MRTWLNQFDDNKYVRSQEYSSQYLGGPVWMISSFVGGFIAGFMAMFSHLVIGSQSTLYFASTAVAMSHDEIASRLERLRPRPRFEAMECFAGEKIDDEDKANADDKADPENVIRDLLTKANKIMS